MSTRAIAPIVGVSHEAVRQDVAAGSGVNKLTPAPPPIAQAADADLSIARDEHGIPPFDPAAGEVLDDLSSAEVIGPAPDRTTRLGGKSYRKPASMPYVVRRASAFEAQVVGQRGECLNPPHLARASPAVRRRV